jgi:murein DD-endopeptidase MepM/ murein hydrolase activator NlpD
MTFLRRAAVFAAVAALFLPSTAGAADPLAQAQARVESARAHLRQVANAANEAENRYYELDGEIARTRAGLDTLRRDMRSLQARARARALQAYVSGRNQSLEEFVAGTDVLDAVRRTEFLDRVNAQGNDAVDQLGAMSEELDVREDRLNEQLDHQRQVKESLDAQEATLQGALEQAQRAEHELRLRIEAERRRAADAARLARARNVLNGGATTSGSAGLIIGSGSWACPAPGSGFVDSFSAPRSGGRRHQGVDMMAPRGSPAVAVVPGSVSFSTSNLGGNQAWVHGNDGNTYFYAHLDSYVGSPRAVQLGEVIGRIGDTGNARGGPTHLHFEIHPGGGAAVDPYPTVRSHC